MMPAEPRDVMCRAMKNLELVRAGKGYEVTQLISSLLCALALGWEPKRRKGDEFSEKLIKSAEADGWPHIQHDKRSNWEPKTLGDVISEIRNALAHGNVEFMSDGSPNSDIAALRLRTCMPPDYKRPKWGATISIENLDAFLKHFIDLSQPIQK